MVIEWVIVAIFVVLGLFFAKMEHHTQKIKIIIIIIVGFVLYFSVMGIFSSEQVSLDSPKGIVNAVYVYFGWMGETSAKLWDIGTDTAVLVGDAIKMDDTEREDKK
jgi:hypothetical protein